LIQAILFGLIHAYQNPLSMLLTGSIGLVMGVVFLSTARKPLGAYHRPHVIRHRPRHRVLCTRAATVVSAQLRSLPCSLLLCVWLELRSGVARNHGKALDITCSMVVCSRFAMTRSSLIVSRLSMSAGSEPHVNLITVCCFIGGTMCGRNS
jgi:hypothetical protein